MKRLWIACLALLLILAVPLTVAAQEAGCTISADSVAGAPGTTVTIPVRISNNPGFTNFAVAVKYDTTALKLEKIDTVSMGENVYLCPSTASVNLAYTAQEGDMPCGYVSGAVADNINGDGILFTVTFTVLREVSADICVDLDLQYMRSADVLTSVFTALTTSVEDGTVSIAVKGDVNADGSITDEDAAFVYCYVNEALSLTDAQRISADVNGDDMIDTTDAALIYRVVHGTLSGFPKA